MTERYIVRTDNVLSKPMAREQAIQMVKDYDKQGISAYIVSEDEGRRLEHSQFNEPKWD